VSVNKAYIEANVKILTGFIEPHFFAGFSGGPKAVLPALADQHAVLANHGAEMIANPKATWGVTYGNPIWEEIREVALLTSPTFLLNVSLNREREITSVYAGDMLQAHQVGTDFVKRVASVGVPGLFDIVITTNSGYPLDLNLYQAVKGMSSAARIVKPGGSIIIATECRDGIPHHGEYEALLREAASPQELLEIVGHHGCKRQDQWQAQIQAQVQLKADVYVYSTNLDEESLHRALLRKSRSVEGTLEILLAKYGSNASIGVLPRGPMTLPYILAKSERKR
jgi:nickel-dependent lactate racemase